MLAYKYTSNTLSMFHNVFKKMSSMKLQPATKQCTQLLPGCLSELLTAQHMFRILQ